MADASRSLHTDRTLVVRRAGSGMAWRCSTRPSAQRTARAVGEAPSELVDEWVDRAAASLRLRAQQRFRFHGAQTRVKRVHTPPLREIRTEPRCPRTELSVATFASEPAGEPRTIVRRSEKTEAYQALTTRRFSRPMPGSISLIAAIAFGLISGLLSSWIVFG
jgi:hypothetical protein